MSARNAFVRALLLGAALLAACNPVDPREELSSLSDTCIPLGQCADGFVCLGTTCYLRAGETCAEGDGFKWQPCALTLGVCATAQRVCENGRLADSCPTSAYGPSFQAQETACGDGLDNDCDGFAEQGRAAAVTEMLPSNVNLRGSTTRVVPFGSGFLAVIVTRPTTPITLPNPNTASSVHARALDAQLRPLAGTSQLLLTTGTFSIPRLQVVPFEGGAFALWTQVSGNQETPQIARIDVGADGSAVLGLAPRASPIPLPDPLVRAAVPAGSQRLLLAWREAEVRGQLYTRDLEPVGAAQSLSAPLAGDGATVLGVLDVAPDGADGFVAGWFVASAASPPQRPALPVRAVRLSSSLERVGPVVGLPETASLIPNLRVLGGRSAEEQPALAWVSVPTVPSSAGVRHALPFAAGSTPSEPRGSGGSFGLDIHRHPDGTVLLFFPRSTGGPFGPFAQPLILRRVGADNSGTERNLGIDVSGDTAAGVFADLHGMPWTLTSSGLLGGLQYITSCSL